MNGSTLTSKKLDWQQLIDEVERVCYNLAGCRDGASSHYKEHLIQCLELYTSNEEDFKQFISYDEKW